MTRHCSTPPLALLSVIAAPFALAACVPAPRAADPAAPPPVATAPQPVPDGPAPTRAIAETIAADPDLATLSAALTAGGLATTLTQPGAVTIFAPTEAAFGRLASGVVPSLLNPENKTTLTRFLNYHVVAGSLSSAELLRRIAAGGGSTTLTTLAGQPLTATTVGGVVTLTDVGGNRSYVERADLVQSNGMIHVVNGVLVPKLD